MGRVTIGMPVYNAMPYLPQAIESILNQELEDFDFIIVDDGSSDDSLEYLRSLRDARVKVIHQENAGTGAARNRCFDLCESEFFAVMDADDVSLPQRLGRQLEFLKEHDHVTAVGSQVAFLIDDWVGQYSRMPTDHNSIMNRTLNKIVAICHPATMVRMSAVRTFGGYRIQGAGLDFDFFIRLGEVGTLANIDEVLHHYRMHLGSIVATKHDHVRRGIAYAIECYHCRQSNRAEPVFEDFAEIWSRRGNLIRAKDNLTFWSGMQYRRALMDLAAGRKLRGTARMAIAGACRPGAVLRQVQTRILG